MPSSRQVVSELTLLVGRLGISGVGKKLGKSSSTIRDWLFNGVPEKSIASVIVAWSRSESSRKAYETREAKKLGIEKVTFSDIDKLIKMPAGYTKGALNSRAEYWGDVKGEWLTKPEEFFTDNGKLMYVDGDGVTWRGYTVTNEDGDTRLFWSKSTTMDAYDVLGIEEFIAAYESLQNCVVAIIF